MRTITAVKVRCSGWKSCKRLCDHYNWHEEKDGCTKPICCHGSKVHCRDNKVSASKIHSFVKPPEWMVHEVAVGLA